MAETFKNAKSEALVTLFGLHFKDRPLRSLEMLQNKYHLVKDDDHAKWMIKRYMTGDLMINNTTPKIQEFLAENFPYPFYLALDKRLNTMNKALISMKALEIISEKCENKELGFSHKCRKSLERIKKSVQTKRLKVTG